MAREHLFSVIGTTNAKLLEAITEYQSASYMPGKIISIHARCYDGSCDVSVFGLDATTHLTVYDQDMSPFQTHQICKHVRMRDLIDLFGPKLIVQEEPT